MFNRKILIVVSVLLLVVMAVPSLGATFRKKKITEQQFLEMCKEGDTQGVIAAINAGVNVNAKDNNGGTALMWAALKCHTNAVELLLKYGADVNAKANDGYTALIGAAGSGYTETVNVLISAGADVNAQIRTDGSTALMWAALYSFPEIVNALIEAGADDLTDNYGRTALIHSTLSTYLRPAETVNVLIDAGSYVKHKDKNGKTALDYARNNNNLKGTDALRRLEELSK